MIRSKTIFEMKVYRYFIITVVISILIFGIFISNIGYGAIYEREMRIANKELETICMQLDSLAKGIVKESLYLIVNQNYQKVISEERDTDYIKFSNSVSLSNMLNSIAISQKEWESIVFYKGMDIYQSNYKQYSEEFWEIQKEIVKQFSQSEQVFAWKTISTSEDAGEKQEAVVSYLRKVYSYGGVFQGILEINMPYSRLLEIIPAHSLDHMEIAFEKSDHETIVATKQNEEIEILKESKRYIKLQRQSERTGLFVRAYYDSNYISRNISALFVPIFLLMAVIISIASICISILSNKISRPITNIENVVKLVSKGNREMQISEIPEGALGELSVQINEMIKSIDGLIRDNQKIEEQKRILELNYIQLQINPHFLYNSLETVCGMIEEKEKNSAINMINHISLFYREILKREEALIPLEEEIHIVKNYIKIMQYRYPHLFSYTVKEEGTMDQQLELRKIPIIKLILQPLVENCIEHAFIDKKAHDYFISIQIKQENEICYIDVSDNGIGFTKEKKEFLNCQMVSNHSKETTENFAIRNINARLKLQFGQPFGVIILDNEDRGATIRITIPRCGSNVH